MSGAKAVVLDDVSFRYLDESELAGQERASSGAGGRVCGVSLDVAYGSCTVICGRSGDGKSTVLRLIDGLDVYKRQREVRATNQEERYLDGIRKHIDEAERQTVKGELATGICVNGAQIVLRLGIATTVLAGAAFVLEGTCGFMTLFCFLLVVSRIYAPFDQCLMLIAELFAAKTASARMRSFYDEPLANGGDSYAPQGHDVVFDDVSFSYGDGEQVRCV